MIPRSLVRGLFRWSLYALAVTLLTISGELLRDRSVQCNSNEMRVLFEFNQAFNGVVYSNKFYGHKECRWEGNETRHLVASIPLNSNPNAQPYCGVQLKEDTGEFTAPLIISPIRGLLVDGMEGLTVRCLYNIGDVTLTLPAGVNGNAGIYISPQTQNSVVTGSGGSPFLQMTIRDGHGINGENVQSALVGQRISLDVVMRDTTIYDFWVHDCYAHDGTNTPEASISIIDANGCAVRLTRAVDVPVFTTTPVPNGAKHVYVHLYGFQFTTSQLVFFECQVRPCLQSCQRALNLSADYGLTALGYDFWLSNLFKQCVNSTRFVRQSKARGFNNISTSPSSLQQPPENYNLTAIIRIEPQQVESVIPALAQDAPVIKKVRSSSELCIDTSIAVAILVILALVCVGSLFVALCLCNRVRKEAKKESQRQQSCATNYSVSTSHRSSSASTPSSASSFVVGVAKSSQLQSADDGPQPLMPAENRLSSILNNSSMNTRSRKPRLLGL